MENVLELHRFLGRHQISHVCTRMLRLTRVARKHVPVVHVFHFQLELGINSLPTFTIAEAVLQFQGKKMMQTLKFLHLFDY